MNNDSVDILGIAETWLDSTFSDSSIHIPHYRLLRHGRGHRPGGGIAVYSRDTLAASRHDEPESDTVENLIHPLKTENPVNRSPSLRSTFHLPLLLQYGKT